MTTATAFIQQIQDLDRSVQHDNLETVIHCIETPLSWFDSLDHAQQLLLVKHENWEKHVWTVFHVLVPQWTFSLLRAPLMATLWQDKKMGVAMARRSLPILLDCLTKDVSLDTLEIYAAGLKRLAFSAFKDYRQLDKEEMPMFCSLLCSIPGRLTNALGAHGWYSDALFYTRLAQLLAQYPTTLFSGELLAKMVRQGYQDKVMPIILPIAVVSPEPFPALFKHAAALSSSDTLIKCILDYALNRWTPYQLASVLGFNLEDFLICALVRLRTWSMATEHLAKLAVCAAVSAGLDDLEAVMDQVTQTWSNPIFIKNASLREKEYVTVSMLVLLGHLEDREISMSKLVKSISLYFDQGDRVTAQLGALVAESISSRLDQKPLDTGLLEGNDRLLGLKQIVWNAKEVVPLNKELIKAEPIAETDSEEEEQELDPDANYVPKDEDSDDEFQAYDMNEESDDEGNKRESDSKKHKKPAFIRDLVRYLRDKEDPIKLEIGLNSAEEMIRKSAGIGTELDESCNELAENLISFPETYEIDNSQILQQNALTALIASVPEKVTGYVIDTIYDRNTSVGQAQVILASITLAVRELAGWANTKAKETVEDVTNRLGTSLFVSKRLQVEKKRKTERNRLAGLAGPVFFFPLLVGWWEGAQGRIKHWVGNNTLLVERFVMTLNIILHCSTNTPDKRSIVREYFEFALSMRYANISCKKSLLLGIQVILNESYKDQETLLFQDFMRELIETKEWLEDVLENSSDELKELTIRILLRLSQINQQQLLNRQ